MTHKYSKTTDLIYPVELLSQYKNLPSDLIDISSEEAQLHMGNTLTQEGKRRKPNTYPFEFEDTPPPTPDQLSQQAKAARDQAIESNIALDGAEFDIDAKARDNIAIALRKAERMGYPDSEVRDWRLSDNSWRETTLGELKQLLVSYDERFELVWYQFNVWDSGDKTEPFEVEL